MQLDKLKNRSVLKAIFFYWLSYVLISTTLLFFARKEEPHNDNLPVEVAIATIILLVLFKGLSALFKRRKPLIDRFNKLSLRVRRFTWATLCWFMLVLSFVFIFSPFGRYMDEDDWAVTWKVILFPPFLIALGYVSYVKMIRGHMNDQS